jgi:hypothetical protein
VSAERSLVSVPVEPVRAVVATMMARVHSIVPAPRDDRER